MSWLLSALPSIPGWSAGSSGPSGPSPSESNGASMPGGFSSSSKDEVAEDNEEYDDTPPQFPLPDSAQRSGASASASASAPSTSAPSSLAVPAPSFALAPPSPTTSTHSVSPPSDLNIAIVDAPLGSMPVPYSTTERPSFGIKAGGGLVAAPTAAAAGNGGKGGMPPPPAPLPPATSSLGPRPVSSSSSRAAPALTTNGPTPRAGAGTGSVATPATLSTSSLAPAPVKKKGRGKVALAPGCSALDWARLAKSGANLRGMPPGPPLRVTMEELKKHKSRDDAWSAFNGIVYNITPYLRFHPGGEDELMRVAGRDGTKLFMLTHSWVNLEHLMQECMVGMLVRG